MGLMERVAALIRANLGEIVEKAGDPESVLEHVIRDMENQLILVKTQVARSVAHEQLLSRRRSETESAVADAMRKAETALSRRGDEAARAALARVDNARRTIASIDAQLAVHRSESETLRRAYRSLEQKLADARARRDDLLAQHRRSRIARRAAEAGVTMPAASQRSVVDALRDGTTAEALEVARDALTRQTIDERLEDLDRDTRIELLLRDLKQRKK